MKSLLIELALFTCIKNQILNFLLEKSYLLSLELPTHVGGPIDCDWTRITLVEFFRVRLTNFVVSQ